jgi:hypothetical protein
MPKFTCATGLPQRGTRHPKDQAQVRIGVPRISVDAHGVARRGGRRIVWVWIHAR